MCVNKRSCCPLGLFWVSFSILPLIVMINNNHRGTEPAVKVNFSEFVCEYDSVMMMSVLTLMCKKWIWVCLTGCVGAVCPASEVVLQQLVCPCGTGSSHQPHRGLMKKHLQEKTYTSVPQWLSLLSISRCLSHVGAENHFTPHTVYHRGYVREISYRRWSLSCQAPHSTMSEYFSVISQLNLIKWCSSCGS